MILSIVMALVVLNWTTKTIIRARTTRAMNACVNNLRQIQGTKEQWGIDHQMPANAIPTWADIQPYLGRGPDGTLPHCPDGGVYIIGRVNEAPKCSIGGPSHTLD
jgi:hypothetical protein